MKKLLTVALISAFLTGFVMVEGTAAKEGQKLREKLPSFQITSQVKGCHEDMQEHCPGLPENS